VELAERSTNGPNDEMQGKTRLRRSALRQQRSLLSVLGFPPYSCENFAVLF